MLFSIIIPTFNRKYKLRRCLQSVKSNNLDSAEVIVIDDGSTDGTGQHVKDNYPWVKYVYQKNKGVSSARNIGMQLAVGQYIVFLDSDDVWYEHRLDTVARVVNSLPDDVGLVFNDMDSQKEGKRNPASYADKCFEVSRSPVVSSMFETVVVSLAGEDVKIAYGDIYDTLLQGNVIQPSCAVLRRSVFSAMGGFREEYKVAEDSEYFLRVAKSCKVSFIPQILTTMEEPSPDGSLSSTKNNIEKIKVTISFTKEHLENSKVGSVQRSLLQKRISQLCALLGYHYLTQLDRIPARKSFRSAIKWAPSSYNLYIFWGVCCLPKNCIILLGLTKKVFKKID